jgi:hypothetical protein
VKRKLGLLDEPHIAPLAAEPYDELRQRGGGEAAPAVSILECRLLSAQGSSDCVG